MARQLGVAPATLRTWARRYGLGPDEHTSGAHRRYSVVDVARLRHMRRLTQEGVAPADAARLALAEPLGAGASTAPPTVPAFVRGSAAPTDSAELTGARTGTADEPLADSSPALDGTTGGSLDAARARGGGPGGRVLALRTGQPAARGLARAAMALDDVAVSRILREHLDAVGVVVTWEDVVAPVLVAVGQRWAATGEGVEVEHLLSECASAVFREGSRRADGVGRPALLACAENDQHALPLNALAAGLAEKGVASRVLGAAVPTPALVSAIRRTGPIALFLWSQVRATASPEVLTAVPPLRPPVALVVGGPGWRTADLPPRVAHARDLQQAISLVAAATGR